MSVKKVGAYICKGCGLGERLNIKALENIATREGKTAYAKSHDFLCSQAGVDLIKADIAEGTNFLVIGACSRRAKTEAFNFEGVNMSRVNLREGVIWVRPNTPEAKETTQEMAEDYVRMGCAELKHMNFAAPSTEQSLVKHVLVVGGGITGMTAALEAVTAGYQASIVEKSEQLGGVAKQLYKRISLKAPFKAIDNGVSELKAKLESNPNVKIYLNSTISQTNGAPGRFSVDIDQNGTIVTETFGAIIQATGFTPFDMNKLPELGAGKSPDVVDQMGLEMLATAANGGAIKRPSDGKEVKSVLFVQCAGQRSQQEGHLSYCSGHCCLTSIKQATYFKDHNPNADTVVLFTDLRTPGAGGENFYRSGQEKGVTFTKGVAKSVAPNGSGLKVTFDDLILNQVVEQDFDLIVLATGMIPTSGVDIDKVEETTPPEQLKALSILNLNYRQGRDMPQLVHGFVDSHFICFPYETRRTGIYAAGPVRRPMDIAQAQEDATGAALKAIQAIENAALGRAAHPRSGDLSFPKFRKEGCTQCKRCTVECPFGAINEDENRYPVFNEARCRRCGTCMGACPVRVISFENYSIETVGQQIKAVNIPDEYSEKPRLLVLACENDAYPALDMAGMNRLEYSAYVRIIPVRCLGSVNTIWLTDALNSGYDGVMLMGCQKGVDYQCHFVRGSEMAHYRMSKIDDTLKQLNLEGERVATYEIAITDVQKVPQLINEMAETVQRIGMSPFKF